MYKNILAEMSRAGMTQSQLSELTGITLSVLNPKLKGHRPFSVPEAIKIKEVLTKAVGENLTLDYLFKND